MSKKLLTNISNDIKNRLDFLRLKNDGLITLRFLPNGNDLDGVPYFSGFVHYNFVNPRDVSKTKTFRCLGYGCQACALAKKAREESLETYDSLKSSFSSLHYVMEVKGNKRFEDYNSGDIKILTASQALQRELIGEGGVAGSLTISLRSGINAYDISSGRLVDLERVSVAQDYTKYRVKVTEENFPLNDDVIYSIKNNLKDIRSFFARLNVEEVKDVVEATKNYLSNR